MKLLIADDEKIIRQGLMEVDWRSIGIEKVECVSSGTVALQIIAEDCPDVILADICMPGFSGLELAKFIDEKKYKCKVILLTGYEKFSYAKDAIRYYIQYNVQLFSCSLNRDINFMSSPKMNIKPYQNNREIKSYSQLYCF